MATTRRSKQNMAVIFTTHSVSIGGKKYCCNVAGHFSSRCLSTCVRVYLTKDIQKNEPYFITSESIPNSSVQTTRCRAIRRCYLLGDSRKRKGASTYFGRWQRRSA